MKLIINVNQYVLKTVNHVDNHILVIIVTVAQNLSIRNAQIFHNLIWKLQFVKTLAMVYLQ